MTATDAETLARQLIFHGESPATIALCLADFDDALRRSESSAERARIARQTIRVYTRPSGKEFSHAARKIRLPA